MCRRNRPSSLGRLISAAGAADMLHTLHTLQRVRSVNAFFGILAGESERIARGNTRSEASVPA
jgi:hypothetical protein